MDLIQVAELTSTRIMTVPIGTFTQTGQISVPDVHRIYDILYICTGVIVFEFRGNNFDHERIGVLTTHGKSDPLGGVPIQDEVGNHLRLINPNTQKRTSISNYAVTVSLARINNHSSDNGIWSVQKADLKKPFDSTIVEPELNIQLSVEGDDGIKFERVSYTAFIQVNTQQTRI